METINLEDDLCEKNNLSGKNLKIENKLKIVLQKWMNR